MNFQLSWNTWFLMVLLLASNGESPSGEKISREKRSSGQVKSCKLLNFDQNGGVAYSELIMCKPNEGFRIATGEYDSSYYIVNDRFTTAWVGWEVAIKPNITGSCGRCVLYGANVGCRRRAGWNPGRTVCTDSELIYCCTECESDSYFNLNNFCSVYGKKVVKGFAAINYAAYNRSKDIFIITASYPRDSSIPPNKNCWRKTHVISKEGSIIHEDEGRSCEMNILCFRCPRSHLIKVLPNRNYSGDMWTAYNYALINRFTGAKSRFLEVASGDGKRRYTIADFTNSDAISMGFAEEDGEVLVGAIDGSRVRIMRSNSDGSCSMINNAMVLEDCLEISDLHFLKDEIYLFCKTSGFFLRRIRIIISEHL